MASAKTASSARKPGTIPVLTYGAKTNFEVFARDLYTVAVQEYDESAQFLKSMTHFEAPVVTVQYWMDNGLTQAQANTMMLKSAEKKLENDAKVRKDNKKMFGLMWDHMSEDSRDIVSVEDDFKTVEETSDGLGLWKLIKKTHQYGTVQTGAIANATVKKTYEECKMGAVERFARFKERFDVALKNYQTTLSDAKKLSDVEIAWDFFYKLDDKRYDDFMKKILFDYRGASQNQSITYSSMTEMARVYPVSDASVLDSNSAAFKTQGVKDVSHSSVSSRRSNAKLNASATSKHKSKSMQDQNGRDLSRVRCDHCDQLGHVIRKCPAILAKRESRTQKSKVDTRIKTASDVKKVRFVAADDDVDDDEHDAQVLNAEVDESTTESDYLALLDNQANISIVHPTLLRNVSKLKKPITVMGAGGPTLILKYEGELPGCFKCYASADSRRNILCFADMEDQFDISYVRGKSFTVHMPRGDLVFHRKDKFYVADISDWAKSPSKSVLLTSSKERERKYTRKQVELATLAYRFAEKTGATSLSEVIRLATSGNVSGVKFTKDDIIRAYDIWGHPVSYVKGAAVKQKTSRDRDLIDNLTEPTLQSLDIDMFSAAGFEFLLSVAHPLRLTLVSRVDDKSGNNVAKLFQDHLDKIRSKGFNVRKVYSDQDRVLKILDGKFPAVDFHAGGAGDHVVRADERIKALKILARSMKARVPWDLPRIPALVDGLIKCAVSRLNMHQGRTNDIPPMVKFTGHKPRIDKEYALVWGDYCEAYDPKVVSNTLDRRTESCIALYPCNTAHGSWRLYNIKTGKVITRSNHREMVTTDLVIHQMNTLAKRASVGNLFADDGKGDDVVSNDSVVDVRDEQSSSAEVRVQSHQSLSSPRPDQDDDQDDDDQDDDSASASDADSQTSSDLSSPSEVRDDHPTIKDHDADSNDDTHIDQSHRRSTRVVRPAQQWWQQTSQTLNSEVLKHTTDTSRRIGDVKFASSEVFHLSIKKGIQLYGDRARDATRQELKQMLSKNVWEYVHRAPNNKFIRSSLFLKEKLDAQGHPIKIKGRLVARGDQQEMQLYDNWSSPTIRTDSVKMILKIAQVEARKVHVIDIGGAYLNADMDDEVYMLLEKDIAAELCHLDPVARSHRRQNGSVMVKLKRALYGCKQSGKLWHGRLKTYLLKLGFVQNAKDACVFNIMRDDKQLTIGLHVDDLLITSESLVSLHWLYDMLLCEFKELTRQDGPVLTYLGMTLQWDKDGNMLLSMDALIKDVLDGVDASAKSKSPANPNAFKVSESTLLSKDDKEYFHSTVAKIQYLALHTRPDLLLAVSALTRRVQAPTEHDRSKLDRILHYLNSHQHMPMMIDNKKITRIRAYVDASFAVHPDAKSHTGLAIFAGGTLVHWKSSKQKICSVNSTEAEMIALSDKLIDIVSCHEFLVEQGLKMDTPLVLQDNTSTMILSQEDAKKIRNKHLLARQQTIQEWVRNSDLRIKHVSTTVMVADFFTKPLQGTRFETIRDLLLGVKVKVKVKARVGGGALGDIPNRIEDVRKPKSQKERRTSNKKQEQKRTEKIAHKHVCAYSTDKRESDAWLGAWPDTWPLHNFSLLQ